MIALIINGHRIKSERLCAFLIQKGHSIDVAEYASRGINMSQMKQYDVIAIGSGLPDMDSLSLCRLLRKNPLLDSRLIILGDRNTIESKLEGFEAGADDYMANPFAFAELEARFIALARRFKHVS